MRLFRTRVCVTDAALTRARAPSPQRCERECDGRATAARHLALEPPLLDWIYLRHQDEASGPLGAVLRARWWRGGWCMADQQKQCRSRLGSWAAPRRHGRRHAGEHGTRSSVVAEEGTYLVPLAVVTNNFVSSATGASRVRSSDDRHKVHDDTPVYALLLEQPEVLKARLTARRHTTHAHTQQLNA